MAMEKKQKFGLGTLFEKFMKWWQVNASFSIYVFALCMLYIYNNHASFRLIKEINVKAKLLKEIRWEFLTKKSELMSQSKLTSIRNRAHQMDLYQLEKPPIKITLKSEDYQRQK